MPCFSPAALVLHIDNATQTATAGDVVRFTGTITNTGPEVFLFGGLGFSPGFPAEYSLLNLPFELPPPGATYVGEILSALVNQAAVGKTLSTQIYLFAWDDNPPDLPNPHFSNAEWISLSASAVPEPAYAPVLAAVGAMAWLLRLPRERRPAASRPLKMRLPRA